MRSPERSSRITRYASCSGAVLQAHVRFAGLRPRPPRQIADSSGEAAEGHAFSPNTRQRSRCFPDRFSLSQDQLLHPPVGRLSGVHFHLWGAGELGGAPENSLNWRPERLYHSQHLAIQVNLERSVRERALSRLKSTGLGTWCDADRIRGANHLSQALAGWRVAVHRVGSWRPEARQW